MDELEELLVIAIVLLPAILQFAICLRTEKVGIRAIPMVATVTLWAICVILSIFFEDIRTDYWRDTVGVSDQQIFAVYGVVVIFIQVLGWRAGAFLKDRQS